MLLRAEASYGTNIPMATCALFNPLQADASYTIAACVPYVMSHDADLRRNVRRGLQGISRARGWTLFVLGLQSSTAGTRQA